MSTTQVPLLDLKAQYAPIRNEVMAAMERIADSQQFILGAEVEALEAELAEYCQAQHAIGVSSGTDALLLGLMALDVGSGDEVITTPYTFFATGGAVARLGATPVFVDIDPVSFNIDPELIEDRITSKTKGIIAVHLYGQCADMTAINEVAAAHRLFLIEDAAQAIGAEHDGRRAGSLGTLACFSFFPSKNLGAFGDAGAVTTDDAKLAEKMRRLRVHGGHPKYFHSLIGGNFRIDALQAAVLRVKLKYLDAWTAGRQQNAARYSHLLADSGLSPALVAPPTVVESRHIFNQFIVRAADRDRVVDHFKQHGVGCEIYYPVPLHLQECFAPLGYQRGDLPHSEAAAASTLALPIYPELSGTQQQQVVDTLVDFYRQAGRLTRGKAA